jgi:hypothetical protein
MKLSGTTTNAFFFIACFSFFVNTFLGAHCCGSPAPQGFRLSPPRGQYWLPRDVKVWINDSLITADVNNGVVYYAPANDKSIYFNIVVAHPDYETLTYQHTKLYFQEIFLLPKGGGYFYALDQFKRPCQKENDKLLIIHYRMYSSTNDTIGDADSVLFAKRLDSLGLKIERCWCRDRSMPPNNICYTTTVKNGKINWIPDTIRKPVIPPYLRELNTVVVKKDSSDFSGTNCTGLAALRKYG